MDLFFLLPVTEIVIIVYSFGIGLFLNNVIISNHKEAYNFSEVCIYGFLLTLIISQIINFIVPIIEIYFWLFFIFSIINIYKHKYLIKKFFKWLIKISIIFLILTPFKIVIKGHDDIFYHLPKLDFINNHKIIFGIGNYYESFAFTNGWSHISAFFNIFYGYEKNLYLVSFIFFILIINTLYFYFKRTNDNNIKLFTLISITFLCLKFYRLQEFGNDFQSILLVFLIFNLFFIYLKTDENNEILIKKIILYSAFATLFKIHGILVNLFLILFLFRKYNFFKKENLSIYLFIIISYLSTFMTSFVNSGCILYPFKSTCLNIEKVSWSAKENINNVYLEAYNKGYEKKFLNESNNKLSHEEWLKDFNWFKFHFTSKNFYEPFIKSIILLFLIFFLIIKFIDFKIQKMDYKNLVFLLISIIILVIWMIKIPLMRANGYGYVICTLIFLFSSFIKVTKVHNFKKLTFILFILVLFPLLFLNTLRIYKETKRYETNNIFYFLNDYGKNSEKSMYKNLNLVVGTQSVFGKKYQIESKFNYYIIKYFKKT